ncbi:MAG: hypothetical protein A2Z13_09010 [Deltaproteobacteria bacterium RBG_16_64_85]|nr:MAG: hypothetical protein A2Z13_09010 [Deltaproteobacteria bacterium RBG_16_64_85]
MEKTWKPYPIFRRGSLWGKRKRRPGETPNPLPRKDRWGEDCVSCFFKLSPPYHPEILKASEIANLVQHLAINVAFELRSGGLHGRGGWISTERKLCGIERRKDGEMGGRPDRFSRKDLRALGR